MNKTVFIIAVSCAFSGMSFDVAAADYYVRPYRGAQNIYGTADGSGYLNAWNGLGNVKWKNGVSVEGVGPGDTLYVCGIHPNPYDSPSKGVDVQQHTQLKVGASGSAGDGGEIVISFDCRDDLGQRDTGTILRVSRQRLFVRGNDDFNADQTWSKVPGFEDVYYSAQTNGNTVSYIEMEYSGSGQGLVPTYRRLKKAVSSPLEDPGLWGAPENAGMALHQDGSLFYRPSAGATRTAFYIDGVRSAIQITGQEHIRVVGREGYDPLHKLGREDFIPPTDRELNILASDVRTRGSRHIEIKGLNIKFSKDAGITPNDDVDNAYFPAWELVDCSDINIHHNRIEWSRVGIYNSVQSFPDENGDTQVTSCDRLWIHHNHVFHTDREQYWGLLDTHGIQIEGGSDHIVEYNVIEYVGTHGIGFDGTGSAQEPTRNVYMNNNVVRYNIVRDVDTTGAGVNQENTSETGFHVNGKNHYYDPDNQRHNRVYNNIFIGAANAGIAITATGKPSQGGYSWAYFNNVVYGSATGYRFSDSWGQTLANWDVGFIFKNNLIAASTETHTGMSYNRDRSDRSGIIINYNGYTIPTNGMFTWLNSLRDLAGWRSVVPTADCGGGICPQELDSSAISIDGAFVNQSGTFRYAADFKPSAFSSAIDAGTFDIGYDSDNRPIEVKRDMFGNYIYGRPDLGAIEYRPPYVAGNDRLTDSARFYGDGRFRELVQRSGTVSADLVVRPQGGFKDNDAYRRMYWDVAVHRWDEVEKSWTVNNRVTAGNSENLYYEVDDLTTGQSYDVYVNGVYWISRNAFAPGRIEFARGGPATGTEWHFTVKKSP